MSMYSSHFDGELREKRDWPLFAAVTTFMVALVALLISLTVLTGSVEAGERSKYVRVGLNKSIVIRLPAPARDVLVGNPEIVDAVVRTQNTAYLFAKKAGQTNAFFLDANGRQILSLDIEVALDMKALQKLIWRTIPGSRIKVDTIGEAVVLSGTAKNASEARLAVDLATKFVGAEKGEANVMNTISVSGKEQVMLKVRIAELQRDILKQFGIDTQALFSIGNVATSVLSTNPFTLNGALSTIVSSGLASHGGVPSSGVGAFYSRNGTQVGGVLRAMERDGLLRTLAEPTLTAISGESAKFLAGGEFPVPVGRDDDGVTIEFKPFGVGLGFTPVVLSEGRISLRISTEVSEISSDNAVNLGVANSTSSFTIPGLNVRRANTTVELPSGGSMIMAGLIKDSTRQQINGMPGMKNLPILGSLFRSRDFKSSQSELVVIVTPYIVNPVNEKQLATPLDNHNVATDRQTIFFGRLNKVYGADGNNPGGKYHGNVGFIVE